MHKITTKPIELLDFSIDDFYIDDVYNEISLEDMFINVVAVCEVLRQKYLETKDKRYWKGLIQLLPCSYNQKRTVQLNYQVLKNMYFARKNHKLDEWHSFCEWCEGLPYFKEMVGEG
jgi:rhamnogalacturonyl hydrolase YesR